MARAIDSEAAYQFLTDQLVKETGAFSRGVNKGLNIARSAMRNPDAMPTLTPPNDWVSVEERLPEPGERVLATDCGFVGEFYINKRGKWQRYNVNCSELLMALDILYWTPLPAPPDLRPPEGEVNA